MNAPASPHVLLVITEDWYVASHRLPLIQAACAAGWRVSVATRVQHHANAIREAGAQVIVLPIARESRHLLREFGTIRRLRRLYREIAPNVVHHVGVKPVLYGGWAARGTHVNGVLHAFAGMGTLYSDEQKPSGLRFGIETFLRPITRAPRTLLLVQNDADASLISTRNLASPANIRIVRGSGVDLSRFSPASETPGPPLVVLPARMLADKGVREFVQAAEDVHTTYPNARFALVGGCDPANPSAIPEATLRGWVADGIVEWWEHRADMPEVIRQSSIVVLPSYREGLPKVLLEAAASGKAIVTTDVPGCRDVVRHDVNGLLVPPRDAAALAAAISELLANPSRRNEMGRAGRARAEAEFGDQMLAEQTVRLYQELLQ